MGRNEADSGIPAEQRNGGADLFCPEDGGSRNASGGRTSGDPG